MASKKSELVLTCNATAIKDIMEYLDKKTDELIKKRDRLLAKGQQNWTAQDKKNFKQWGDDIAALTSKQQKNREEMVRYGEVMKDLAGAKTKDLKRALGEVKRALDNMSARDPNRANLERDLKRIQNQIDANTVSIKKNQSAWGALGTTMKNLFAYAGIFAGFNLLKSKLDEAYEANKRFSDSMANVRKVSGLTMDEIGKLANNLSKIDSRTGLGGLMELSYTGAKLGYGNYGIEGLESFAKSAVKVQNALAEDMGADSMTALSKMVEVMGLIPKMGVERAMDATGSAIFKLASTSTATGTNIVEFSKRLMGLANIAHISTQDLLAFGSAADSMALMPEVAATAFNKLISAVQKQPNLIENALNIPKGTISDLYQAGHMTEALVTIFEKMREKGGMNALMQSGVFKDLGSDGARLVAVMATMANRVDMLNAHLAVSRQAFEEGTAVAQEYAIQMDTAAAYSERAANIWEKAFVNPEGVDTVKEFTKAWYEVSKALTSNKVAMAEVKFLLGGILELLKGILYFLPALLSGLAVLGAGRMFVALRSSLEMTRLSAVGLTLSLNGLKTAWTALSAVGKANWIGAAATALFMIIEAFGMFNKKVQEATGYMKGFKKDLGDLNIEYGKAESELRRYRRAIDEANTGSKQRLAAINTFNSKFKPYLSNLLTEKSTAKDVADAYEAINKALRAKLALQLKEKDIESQVAPREQWTAERRQEYEKTVRGTQNSQYGAEWITGYAQDNRSKSIRDIARDLNERIFHTAESTFNSVFSQLGSSTLNELVRTKRKVNGHTVIDENVMGPQGRQLWAAMRYILQERSAENAMRRVNKKWEPEQKLMDELTAQQDETPYEPLRDAPDKDAERAAKKAANDAKAAARKELKDAETETNAIIAKVEEWYTLQQNVITESYNDGKITEQQMTSVNQQLEQAKNTALAAARRSLSGQDTQTWQKVKTDMDALMLDQGDWSRELLDAIVNTDMTALRNALMKFDGKKSLEQWGFTSTAFRDGLNKNAAKNEAKVREIDAKAKKQVETFLLQYDFINQAYKSFSDQLVNLGILTETAQQMAKKMADADNPEVLYSQQDFRADQQRQEQSRRDALTAFLKQGSRPYSVDVNNASQLQDWLRELTGAEFDGIGAQGMELKFHSWAEAFRDDFTLWIKDADKYKTSIQEFFMSLMTAEDNYYKKRKEAYNNAKTHLDQSMQAAGWTDQYDEAQTELSGISSLRKITGEGENLWQQHGLQDTIAEDPEIKAIQLRIAMRQKEFEEAKALGESQQLIAEKQNEVLAAQADLAEQVGNSIANRISHLRELSAPLEEFGEDVGQKLGDALFGLQSTSDTWNQITKKMILSVSKMTVQMASQYLQQKLQQALTNKAIEAQEIMHQATMQSIAIAGGTARVAAEQVTNTQLLTATEIADRLRIAKEARVAAIMAAFGVSEGAAKTIAALGFWGIPLIGVITSVLMGLLSSALSTAGSESESSSSSTAAAPKTKLVSGMLTYGRGNVDKFAGRRKLYDDGETQVYGRRRYLGEDGKVYTATAEPAPKSGLVKHPIATTVEGQPALVAERGPEIVIGRETTENIMRNAPELLQAIVDIDKNPHKKPDALPTYDKGNVSEVAGEAKAADNSEKVQEVTMRVNRDNRYHTERQDERNNEEQSVAMSEESLQRMMEQFRKTRISHEATNKHRRQQEDSRKESMRRDSVTTDAKDSTESLTRWFRDFATAEMTTQYVTLGEWAKAPESHIGEIKQLYKVLSSHDEQTRRSDQQAIERTMDTINNVKDITSVKTESENTVVSEEALSKMTAKFRTIEEQRRLDTNDTAAVTRWLNDFVTTDVTSMEDVRSQKEDVTKKSAVSSKKSDVQDTSTISRQTSDIKNREVREQFVKSMPAVEQWQTEPEKHVREIIQLYNTLATHDEQMRRSEQEHAERSIATVNDVMSIIGMKTDATSTDRQQSVKITEDIATEMVRKHRQVEEQRRQREEQEQKRVKDATSWLRDFVTTDVTSLEDVRSQKEDVTKKSAVSSKKSDVQDTSTVSHQTSDIKNSEVRESFTKAMPHVDEWLKEPEKHVEEIMQLRSMLTRYDEQLQRSEVGNSEHNEVDSKQRIARSISDNIDRNETAAFSDEVLNQMVSKHRSINEQRRLREEQEQKRSSVDERSRSDVQDVRRTFDKGNVEEVTKRRRLDTSNTEEMTRWLNDFVTTDVTSLEDVRSQKEDVTKKLDVSSKKSDVQDTSTVSRQTSDIKNSEVRESFTKAMPHVDEWLQEPEKHQQEIAKLYTTLTDIDERERISREESSRMDDRRTDSATVRRDSVTTDKNIALTEQYYKGEDGRTYKAQPGAVPEGVTLLTKPIATMINGEPSLVAEKGPELVIGRETTKAMQLNRPDLLRAIVSFDKNKTQQSMRMFDQGNIQSIGADTSETPVSDANEERQALRQQMTQMQDVMNGVLYYLQHPVRPKIDMYSHGGEDGLYDSMKKATKFMSRYGG